MIKTNYLQSALRVSKAVAAVATLGIVAASYWANSPSGIKPEYLPITQTAPATTTLSGKDYRVTSLKHPILTTDSLIFSLGENVEAIVSKTAEGIAINVMSNPSLETFYSLMDMTPQTFNGYVESTRKMGRVDSKLLKYQREGNLGWQQMFWGTKRENHFYIKN